MTPQTVDLAAAARALLAERSYSGQGTAVEGATAVWEALTGMTGADALAYAQQVSVTRQTAAVIPF